MPDLIIKVNLKESTEQYLLVEAYLGHLKALKKRTFSGPLKPIDVLQVDHVDNLSNVLLNKIQNFLHSESRQIKKYKYLLSLSSFKKFLALLSSVKGVYCTSHDRALYELDGIYTAEIKMATTNASNSIKRFFLDVKDLGNIYLNGKSYYRNIGGNALVFVGNHLYLINQNIDNTALRGVLESKESVLSISDPNRIPYNGKVSRNRLKEISNLHPVPVLYVTFCDMSISGKFFFSYNGYEVPCNSSEERLHDVQNGAVYLRSLMEESRALSHMATAEWKRSSGNSFFLRNPDLAEKSLSMLIENGFEILTLDHKKISSAKNANFNISYGVDWFELSAVGKADKHDLTHLINLKSRKRYIELNNEIILLPDIIWEKRKIFKQSAGRVKASKNYLGHIFELLEQPGVSSSFCPDDVISYGRVCLQLPPRFDNILRQYQKDGARWLVYLYQNNLGGCLADDMGLGKTIQAIAFILSQYFVDKQSIRILIVVPKTLVDNWRGEFKKFGEGIFISIYQGSNRDTALKAFFQHGGVLLTTYNVLLSDIHILTDIFFHCMFIDEAQYIKNYKAKTYAAAHKINARSKFILSGTPFENNIRELWALMDLINPGCLDNRTAFMRKYGDLSNQQVVKRLNARIKPFILRRLKKDVLRELPARTEINMICDMGDTQRELYDSILVSVRSELERVPSRFEIKDASIILEGLLYLRQICCHPALLKKALNWNHCCESGKYDLFKSKVAELQGNKEKVIVFSQFTTMLGIMKKWADRQSYVTFYLDGTTEKRQEVVESFERADTGIFFISLKVGGVGLNIVSCQYAIIYDPWWNPAVENQAADRIYRIGQTKNVFIYHLVTANSIEEKIEYLKTEKREIADNILIGTGESGVLSIEELRRLIIE